MEIAARLREVVHHRPERAVVQSLGNRRNASTAVATADTDHSGRQQDRDCRAHSQGSHEDGAVMAAIAQCTQRYARAGIAATALVLVPLAATAGAQGRDPGPALAQPSAGMVITRPTRFRHGTYRLPDGQHY